LTRHKQMKKMQREIRVRRQKLQARQHNRNLAKLGQTEVQSETDREV